ncbi:formylglycine-generating enzyme family protein [Pontivivens insulae]|uniref:Serine/threonine-protein kinase pkn1 n=1 Tax=Pontivivens insulae TaxID=1639689 RepID=A0A2R8AAY1_9RHOB|nr:SUMF1/EgtB/PvdO family nonheme iron enzyme [Pontivivens insulae]RED13291.1 formylglycine-generating enzyme required for sulfatase activity [Pontivivens insulae]SPF29383.1 Serine/threonine-protein kinase pkn1 [Pontivivens insulae]
MLKTFIFTGLLAGSSMVTTSIVAQSQDFLLRNVPFDANVRVNGAAAQGEYDEGRSWFRFSQTLNVGDEIIVEAPLFADLFQRAEFTLSADDINSRGQRLDARTYLAEGVNPADSYGVPFTDCAECPPMVIVAGGSLPGAPLGAEPIAPFAIGQGEVTFDAWSRCVAEGGCNRYRPADDGFGTSGLPVINVSHADAVAFTDWLSSLDPAFNYRLPTGEEWEFAARGGTDTVYWTGNDVGYGIGNYDAFATRPVMSFAANAYDLFDVSGNVWEWTADCWEPAAQDGTDCNWFTQRGGSWSMRAEALRVENRRGAHEDWRHPTVGFRVVRTFPMPSGS